ncbi:MAG TPA: LysR substrate-binding domain-containing protein [Noviherbaspirillum sp.]|uniref:LysR substrate-binding domain-containing protein n=1 Tax=Noviherbaspirillum sp. TaxID=1926288 RepID=UPI002D4D9B36|nr:LysR substrate-binding domain-containing protein [Noviherbaspirillum sp.]HYD94566.1 LysR substrate-binding domain-containing protein [Noviherbaspirillum sp.]
MNRHITLKQFRYFLAVAESASVASAARMINIAQSAVTKSIQELEESLGVQLFERTAKGMVLTQEGHRFQASARKVMSAVAEASRIDYRHEEELSGNLTIGVTSLVAGYYLADLFSRFQRSHPSVKISVIEDSAQFLEHLLINGEVDLAIMVSNVLGDPQALVVETLTSSPNRVWLAASHPLAARPELTLAECAEHEQVVLETDRVEGVLRAVWARYGLRPQITLRTSSLEAVRSLVGVGAGIAILPDFLYRPWTLDAEHVEVRTLRDAVPSIDIGLVWRRGSHINPVTSEFIHLAREKSRSGRGR